MIAVTLGTLLLAVPQAGTVEDRIRELESRLGALEKRAATAKAENDSLEKKLAAAEKGKETYIRSRAASWIARYAKPAGLSEARCLELEKLQVEWGRAEFGKRVPVETWTRREAALRTRLTSGETDALSKAVRDAQVKSARDTVSKFVAHAKVGPNGAAALERAVLIRLEFPNGMLLVSAHPGSGASWPAVHRAVEASISDPEVELSGEERSGLQARVDQWRPRLVEKK